jgi:glucosamine-6-phosphate deaminase
MAIIKQGKIDKLEYLAFETRTEMGEYSAREAAAEINRQIKEKGEINMIFAAAPSQNEVLYALATDGEIPWEKVNAFHMDEYIGLSPDAPQGFGNFLKAHIFGLVPFGSVNYIDISAKDPEAECERYAELLADHPTDIVVMGIGENGHIAFNDPPVADFNDPKAVKSVLLDEICRNQQVNDGCFASIDLVPTHAYTLTVPVMMRVPRMMLVVPTALKAKAIRDTVLGPVDEMVPASAVRTHKIGATLYTDEAGASLI